MVADHFDVVAIGVEDVGAVIGGVIELAYSGPAVVGRAGLERGGVEASTVARSGAVKATCTFSLVGSRWSVIQNHGFPSRPKPPVRGAGSI